MPPFKKSCCFVTFKYLTILCLLVCLVGAGFTVPMNLETLKDLENSFVLTTTSSSNGRYVVYISAGLLALMVALGLIAVSIESYCITLFLGVFLSLFTIALSGAIVYTVFAFTTFVWINCLEVGLCLISSLFVLFFAGMVKDSDERRNRTPVVPFVLDKKQKDRDTITRQPIKKALPIPVPIPIPVPYQRPPSPPRLPTPPRPISTPRPASPPTPPRPISPPPPPRPASPEPMLDHMEQDEEQALIEDMYQEPKSTEQVPMYQENEDAPEPQPDQELDEALWDEEAKKRLTADSRLDDMVEGGDEYHGENQDYLELKKVDT